MNTVALVGDLARDPELRATREGVPECSMTLAVARRARDGRRYPGVVYLDVTAFGDEAEECAERLSEGSRIGVSGRLTDDPRGHVLIDQLAFL